MAATPPELQTSNLRVGSSQHSGGLDRPTPLLDLARDMAAQILRRLPLGCCDHRTDRFHFLLHGWGLQRRDGDIVKLLHDWCWRVFRQEEAIPIGHVEPVQTLLM